MEKFESISLFLFISLSTPSSKKTRYEHTAGDHSPATHKYPRAFPESSSGKQSVSKILAWRRSIYIEATTRVPVATRARQIPFRVFPPPSPPLSPSLVHRLFSPRWGERKIPRSRRGIEPTISRDEASSNCANKHGDSACRGQESPGVSTVSTAM